MKLARSPRPPRPQALVVLIAASIVGALAGSPLPATADTPSQGTISGQVSLGTAGNTAAAGDVGVQYRCDDTAPGDCNTGDVSAISYTDANGNYALTGLRDSGYYWVFFTYERGSAYQGFTREIHVTDASSSYEENVTLSTPPPPNIISGVVGLGSADALASAGSVKVVAEKYGGTAYQGYSWVPAATYSDVVGADGSYSISVPPGLYRLEFVPTASTVYPTVWWVEDSDPTGIIVPATLFQVADGGSLTTINMTIPTGAFISGAITRTDGKATSSEYVTAYDASWGRMPNNEMPSNVDEIVSTSNANGTFTVGPLVPGTYAIDVTSQQGTTFEADTYVTDPTDRYAIRSISLQPGQTVSDASAIQYVQTTAIVSPACSNCGVPRTVFTGVEWFNPVLRKWEPIENEYVAYYEAYPGRQDKLFNLMPGMYRADALTPTGMLYGAPFTVNEGDALTVDFAFTVSHSELSGSANARTGGDEAAPGSNWYVPTHPLSISVRQAELNVAATPSANVSLTAPALLFRSPWYLIPAVNRS